MKTEIKDYFTALDKAATAGSKASCNDVFPAYMLGYTLSNVEALLEMLKLNEDQLNLLKMSTKFLNERYHDGNTLLDVDL